MLHLISKVNAPGQVIKQQLKGSRCRGGLCFRNCWSSWLKFNCMVCLDFYIMLINPVEWLVLKALLRCFVSWVRHMQNLSYFFAILLSACSWSTFEFLVFSINGKNTLLHEANYVPQIYKMLYRMFCLCLFIPESMIIRFIQHHLIHLYNMERAACSSVLCKYHCTE